MSENNTPKEGEVVVCKVTRIFSHSAYALILDYDIEGMIHISEIATGWVRNIKDHIKEGDLVVARVIKTGTTPSLSLKRVNKEEKRSKLREYEMEKRAEKLLEFIAKQLKEEKRFDEIKNKIKQELGSITYCFEISLKKEEKLADILPEKWIKVIKEEASKLFKKREVEFRGKISLQSLDENGVEVIKDVLTKAESLGLKVSYVTAPYYLVRYTTTDPKRGEKLFNKKIEELEKYAKEKNCFKSFEFIEI
jgi:translation initiation factor 2 subunit 1